MGDFEWYEWHGKDKKVADLTNKEVFLIHFLKIVSPFLTFITAYFPFSLLWKDRRFHYRFKEIVEADDRIIDIASKKGFWFKFLTFERNEKLLIIVGKFIPLKKSFNENKLIEHFEKIFKDQNIYISKLNEKTVKFLFTRRDAVVRQ